MVGRNDKMTGVKQLTKNDIIQILNETFPDAGENEIIGALVYCSEGFRKEQNQVIVLKRKIENGD